LDNCDKSDDEPGSNSLSHYAILKDKLKGTSIDYLLYLNHTAATDNSGSDTGYRLHCQGGILL